MPRRTRSTRLLEAVAAPLAEAESGSVGHTGLLTALWLAPETAAALAIDGGEAPEDLHVTLCYCGDVSLMGEVAVARAIVAAENAARYSGPIVGTVSGVGRFQASGTSDGKDVVYASVDAPGLVEFRTRLADCLAGSGAPASRVHGYDPHITLAYIEPDAPMPIEKAEVVSLRFDALTIAVGDKRITIPFDPTPRPYMESPRPAPASTGADPASSGAPVEISESDTAILGILEAKKGEDAKGNAWDVLLIKAGLSGNRRFYPAAMLEAAVPLFEGARAYADHPSKDEARNRPERSIRDVVGWFEGVRWDVEHEGIRGTFRVLESADWLRATLKSAWDAGKRDLLGFSINALGTASQQRRADGSTLIEAIEKVVSTDVVTTPGAGGRLLGVLESERNGATDMDPEEIKRLIAEAMAASLSTVRTELSESLRTQITEIITTQAAGASGGGTAAATIETPVVEATSVPAPAPEIVEMREALAEIKRQARMTAIGARVDAAKLPTVHTAKLKARLLEAAGRRDVEDAEVDAEIGFVREILAESGPARPNWSGGDITQGDDAHQKMSKALAGWFQGEAIDGVQPVRDLRESYSHWTGQAYLDADPYQMFYSLARRYDSGVDHKRIQESLSTADWGQAFADVFYLQMMRRYEVDPTYNRWTSIVSDIESVPDFRTRHFIRIGGYGNFALVPELGTYPEVTTPTDEEVTYTIAKYGGIESVSMESLLGDRGNIVRKLPMLMAEGAARTLYEFVLDMATTGNPTLDYDTTALYHANHNNTGTTALSVAGVDAVNVAMRSQASYGNAVDILGPRNTIKNLIVPNELEGRANRIANPSQAYIYGIATPADTETVQDPHRWADKGLMVHVYDKLTDATDWFATADPTRVPTMVVGFLNGRREPELFTQDQPNVGSMFTADKVSFKLRHVFGADILEHRSFYREVVSG